jgi:hypothetical protein
VRELVSEDPGAADELILFEVWNGSQEEWLAQQPQSRTEPITDSEITHHQW